MGLFKRASRVLERARKRLAGLVAINPNLDLGNGLTVAGYTATIKAFMATLDVHNQEVAEFNRSKNGVDAEEIALKHLNRRILAAIGSKFGFDSDEYEMAGGTRRSEIKRPDSGSDGTTDEPTG